MTSLNRAVSAREGCGPGLDVSVSVVTYCRLVSVSAGKVGLVDILGICTTFRRRPPSRQFPYRATQGNRT